MSTYQSMAGVEKIASIQRLDKTNVVSPFYDVNVALCAIGYMGKWATRLVKNE